jgi:hypothetical protein
MHGAESESPVIETPLGAISVAIAVGGVPVAAWTRLDETVWVRDVEDVTVHVALVDPPREFGPHLVLRRRGILVTVHPGDAIPGIEVRVGFDSAPLGRWDNGESLACLSFEDVEAVVTIGGPDSEEIARRIAAGTLPASWRESFRAEKSLEHGVVAWIEERPSATVLSSDLSGLSWRYPAMEAGETCVLTAVVAVALTEWASTAAWYAVDVPYEELSALPTANRGTAGGRGQ